MSNQSDKPTAEEVLADLLSPTIDFLRRMHCFSLTIDRSGNIQILKMDGEQMPSVKLSESVFIKGLYRPTRPDRRL